MLPRLALALLAASFFSACKSSSPRRTPGLPRSLPRISVDSPAASPRHSMSRGEYPFDERGNYVTAWAAQGSRGGSSASSTDYSSWVSSHQEPETEAPPQPEKPGRRSRSSREAPASANPYLVSSTSSPTRPQPIDSPPVVTRSSSTPPSRSSTSPSPRSTSVAATPSPPKPKPAPKPAAKPKTASSTTHTVKAGDTLYGLALRYKSSVAKIKSANSLKSDLIRPGMKLRIPR